jgi:hypothetical protein
VVSARGSVGIFPGRCAAATFGGGPPCACAACGSTRGVPAAKRDGGDRRRHEAAKTTVGKTLAEVIVGHAATLAPHPQSLLGAA